MPRPRSGSPDSPQDTDSPPALGDALTAIETEFALVLGRPAAVQAACDGLRAAAIDWSQPGCADALRRLTALLQSRSGSLAEPVYAFIEEIAPRTPDPWALLLDLLGSREPRVVQRALDQARQLAADGLIRVDERGALALAALADADDSPLVNRPSLECLARLLDHLGLDALYLDGDPRLRRLAARLLDLAQEPPAPELVTRVLGREPATFLEPYLAYTRATHLDVLELAPDAEGAPPALTSLRLAESLCGQPLMREVLAELGWRRVNGGISVRRCVGASVAGAFPLVMTPAEASLLEEHPDTARTFERFLIAAHGTSPAGLQLAGAGGERVRQFRDFNLAHADVLADILDVAPLSLEKVHRILERLRDIVDRFLAIFRTHEDECAVVADVFADLESRIQRELASARPDRPLSAELTRLVQMFEDPQSAGEIRTLHGLKRYLHQLGLRLGFGLAEAGRGTNRTVDLVLASASGVLRVARAIEYVDFEEAAPAELEPSAMPEAVAVVADAFGQQLLHGTDSLPKVRAFCYGNEVHYFIAFRNHPAFVRIDYSPPLRGGMIDLEYYGVSKYELSAHPNPSLDGIRLFFGRLDFDVNIENTRIRARYDKERTVDLTDLLEKVACLFRLVPYLMDVDWIVGNLSLEEASRRRVLEAWAEFFARWGVLPISQLLTEDREGILLAVEPRPDGERTVRWSGEAPYRDRFSVEISGDFWTRLRSAIEERGFTTLPAIEGGEPVAQLAFERYALRPLRSAVARGEILDTGDRLQPCPSTLFRRRHEAERFATILGGDAVTIARSARLARLVSQLERGVRFQTTGTLNGYEVQQAALPLRGGPVTLFALRDGGGIFRLALFSEDEALFSKRSDPQAAWTENAQLDAEVLAARLRRSNLPAAWIEPAPEPPEETAAAIRAVFDTPAPQPTHRPPSDERTVAGLRASPGRAVGVARLGTAGRLPADVENGVLVVTALSPEDNVLLYRAAGVVSTGGGILSHAGLFAMQFRKPAVVFGGEWRAAPGGAPSVSCRSIDYDETRHRAGQYEITERHHLRLREDEIREGDLLVVDADQGALQVLGQHPDALALHEELRQLSAATRRLAGAGADAEVLAHRGDRLRARHQLEKLLGRLTDPVLIRHAVRELLVGEGAADVAGGQDDRTTLLRRLLDNPAATDTVRDTVQELARDLGQREGVAFERVARTVPTSEDLHQILSLRLGALRLHQTTAAVDVMLAACGMARPPRARDVPALDRLVSERLAVLRRRLAARAARAAAPDGYRIPLRHLIRQLAWLDRILVTPDEPRRALETMRDELRARDADWRARLAGRRLLTAADGGLELQPLIGSKAANLAEAARLGEADFVPSWFVVTDRAFRDALEAPVPEQDGMALGAVIARILARQDASDAEKSGLVRRAWESVRLPADLVDDVTQAYRRLCAGDSDAGTPDGRQSTQDVPVAIRSSAREEDTEEAARAGEFDTFLFVRGDQAVIDHLKRAWSGLWTARALHSRAVLGRDASEVGGGVLIQRMVDARVAGVLHTVNIAENRLDEILINVGLGLGEGIVSGTVAADQVIVSKADSLASSQLRFRYLTADKRERVVYDARFGSGTTREATLYHQRLRAALEYVELCELVHAAARLENLYLQPLDMEFAIEGTALYILQIRPVPPVLALWHDTAERHPFTRAEAPEPAVSVTPGGSP